MAWLVPRCPWFLKLDNVNILETTKRMSNHNKKTVPLFWKGRQETTIHSNNSNITTKLGEIAIDMFKQMWAIGYLIPVVPNITFNFTGDGSRIIMIGSSHNLIYQQLTKPDLLQLNQNSLPDDHMLSIRFKIQFPNLLCEQRNSLEFVEIIP